jgi:hypothetical protein
MMDAIQVAAAANPNQKFMFADVPIEPSTNNIWSQIYAVDCWTRVLILFFLLPEPLRAREP